MLLYNDKPYILREQNPTMLEKLQKKEFKRKPIVIQYSPRYKSNPAKGKKYAPPVIPIPAQSIYLNSGDFQGVWTWYTERTPLQDKPDKFRYGPLFINLSKGSMVLGESDDQIDWEFVFFMYVIHPLCYNGLNTTEKQKSEAYFMFHRPDLLAADKQKKREEDFKYMSTLAQMGLAELRTNASAMGMQDARNKDVGEEEVRTFLYEKLVEQPDPAMKKLNREMFDTLGNSDILRKALDVVNLSVKAGVIKYLPPQKQWWLKNPHKPEERGTVLLKIIDSVQKEVELANFLTGNNHYLVQLETLIEESKQKAAEKQAAEAE